jgi:hypothetical protein
MPEHELYKRLEKLERDNRRLKRGSLALLVVLTAMTTIYATRPIPDVVEAHKFLLVDKSGKPRAWLNVTPDEIFGKLTGADHAEMVMVAPDGKQAVCLHGEKVYPVTGTVLGQSIPTYIGPGLDINPSGGGIEGSLIITYSGFLISNREKNSALSFTNISAGNLRLDAAEPLLTLSDNRGFEMDLGGTETVIAKTGQTQKTSADSIIMFSNDKEHHVIWQAP